MRRFRLKPGEVAAAAAVIFFVAGMAVDWMLAGPRLAQVRALSETRASLQRRLVEARIAQGVRDRAAGAGGAAEGTRLSGDGGGLGAVSYVGARLMDSGLRRLELAVVSDGEAAATGIERLFLRAEGEYGQMLSLVRDLETGSPLVSVESLAIRPCGESRRLELRMRLSVHAARAKGA